MGKRSRAAIALTAAAGTLVLAAMPALAATSYPNDYFFANGDQWALTGSAASINAPAAWCASTGANVLVADVDTGANFSHPDLAGKLITDNRDAAFLGGTAPDRLHPTGVGQAAVTDDNGHGSMTTGIMVADTNNGQGIAAVAPDAQALIVKVLDSNGAGYSTDVEYGIEWAVDHGAQVINLSIGPGDVTITNDTGVPNPTSQSPIVQGIQYASQRGVAVAVAAGNSALPASSYSTLLNTSGVATVGALGPGDTVASYSNYGTGVTIYAPGGDVPSSGATLQNTIVSTFIQRGQFDYGYGEGTSFATPQVAGTLADLIATHDSATQAVAAVRNSAQTSSDGFRQLDAAGALGRSKNALCGSPSSGGSVAPPGGGLVGPGGKEISAPPSSHPTARNTQAPATHTAPGAVAAASTPTPAGTGEPTGGAVATGPAGGADQGGRTGPPTGTGGGGGANPLLIVGLGVLILGGAPLGASVVMRLRRPGAG